MARVRQFAKDMGMSYNQANNLVKKGRALKDGGSSILDNTMNQAKPVKASEGVMNNLKPIPKDAKGLQALKKERPDVVAEMGFKKKGGTLKMKSGGQFRGCGAQVKGKKFKGIF
jgi:pyruvate/2-oxoglutarate dehydrogenase complex dihydrolipoamide acyltransferase (E2) component